MEEALDFGQALQALKQGKKVARVGWNGKGMWLIYVPADKWSTSVGPSHVPGAYKRDWVAIKSIDGGLVPWLPSQSDMLSDDWVLVD